MSNSELLAILLRIGTKGTSAIDLARKVLKKFGTFRNMAHTGMIDMARNQVSHAVNIGFVMLYWHIGDRI